MSYLPTTGVPKLQKIQWKMKRLKKAKTAGIQVTSLLELKQFMTPLLMPPTMSALTAATSGVVQAVGSSIECRGHAHGIRPASPRVRHRGCLRDRAGPDQMDGAALIGIHLDSCIADVSGVYCA